MNHTEYLAMIGRRGGKSKSAAKLRAIRENAKKAGRPRGTRKPKRKGQQ